MPSPDAAPAVAEAAPAVAEAGPPAAQRQPRRRLSPMTAFTGTSATFAALFFAAGAPTPLLVQYQHA
jgi:hypothetical protein